MHFPLRLLCLALLAVPATALAQERETPYWASLRSDEVNMRVGPSEDYQIAWVYHREGLPVKVVRLREGWRLVRDPEGAQGWILARLLNPQRTAMVIGKGLAALRETGSDSARLLWNAEPGVVGKLGDCEEGWCEFDAEGRKGWVRQSRLWGAGEP
jgi:SH3-like domain-containing protein